MRIGNDWTEGAKKEFPSIVCAVLNGSLGRGFLNKFLEDSPFIHREFLEVLRTAVDGWIDSGKGDGLDCPLEREVPRHALEEFIAKYPPFAKVGTDGRVVLHMRAPRDFKASARDHAIYCLVMLLDAPKRECLSKCAKCHRYIVRERLPRKGHPIQRGVFCKAHRGEARARSVDASRVKRTRTLVELAARFWRLYKNDGQQESRSNWVAAQMKRELRRLQQKAQFAWLNDAFTGRWVTQNQKAIELKTRGRKYAKG